MSAISLQDVGKRYRLVEDQPLLLKSLFQLHRRRRTTKHIWALRDINLEVEPGETVGVIGRNGSGKTTMLRLIAGVSAPSSGRLRVEGRIAPLIGVGVGFDQELTGRENAFASGRILGMSSERLRRDLDDIVAFAELEDFLDTPVKYYSSGMFLRLAFAVAIHVEPEVLLVDEVLAVGDMAFQAKCFERMRSLQRSGTTIVVVTHSMETVNRMCERAVVLSRGRIAHDGDVEGAISEYHRVLAAEYVPADERGSLILQEGQLVAGGASVTAHLVDVEGDVTSAVRTGDRCRVQVGATFRDPVANPVFGIQIVRLGFGEVFMVHTQPGEYVASHGPDLPLEATIEFDNRLLPGSYQIHAAVVDADGELTLGTSLPQGFTVSSLSRARGIVDLNPQFQAGGRVLSITPSERLANSEHDVRDSPPDPATV